MNPKELEEIGLTTGESRVYLTLLELGSCSVGSIIQKAKISRSKIYDVLNRLIEKGLVASIKEGKVKRFNAVPPTRLTEFIQKQKEQVEERERRTKELISNLNKLIPKTGKTHAEVFYGPRGIKAFFDMSLEHNPNNDVILVVGYPKEASVYFHAYFREYYTRAERKGLKAKVIFDYEAWHAKNRSPTIVAERRYLPKGIMTPAFLYLWGNTVGTIVFTKEQKLCFMIENKEVADSYKEYFNMLWKQAIKPNK